MHSFGKFRVTTVFYFYFILVFLSVFIVLTKLNSSKHPSKKDPTDSKVAAKLHMVNKIKQASQTRKQFPETVYSPCQPLHFIPHAETRPVTALVSFPGSGNTWLRYLIQQSTGVHTGSQYLDPRLQSKGFPGEPVSDASVAVVKTHEWGPKIRERFQKAVLLIRHPRHAVQSFFNLWKGGGHLELAPKITYVWGRGNDWKKFFNEYVNEWQSTYLDWIRNFTGPLHVVLYDQLQHDLAPTLHSLVQFLDLPLDEAALHCTVEHSEGLFHRKPRADNFDPFTEEMKKRSVEVEEGVFEEVEKRWNDQRESSGIIPSSYPLFRYSETYSDENK